MRSCCQMVANTKLNDVNVLKNNMKDLTNIKEEAERLKELKVRNSLTEKGQKMLDEYNFILSFFETNKPT